MFNRSLTFETKRFASEKELCIKVETHKLCQNATFENGGYIQISILHVLLFFSTSLLSRVQDTSGFFTMQKG